MLMSSTIVLLLFVLVALSSAFAPILAPQSIQQQPIISNTRLYESILEAEDRYYEQASQQSTGVLEKPEVVYTVVYNPGTPEEGIHTMKYPRGSDNEVLLIFEGMADCIVFARTIKEDPALDQEPIPTPTSREMIEQACTGMGIQTALVPMENKS